MTGLLRSPTAWMAIALAGVLAWAAASTGQARAAVARADSATAAALAERDAAQAANTLWQLTHQRQQAEAALAEQAHQRLLAEQRQRIADLDAARAAADTALAEFLAQLNAEPADCPRAALAMEAACPGIQSY